MPKSKKTPEEVRAERIKLSHLKKYIPALDPGDRYRLNRHRLIDAQIQVFKWDFDLADIRRNWPNETHGDEQGAAEDALYWRQGGDIPAPSYIWELVAAKNPDFAKK